MLRGHGSNMAVPRRRSNGRAAGVAAAAIGRSVVGPMDDPAGRGSGRSGVAPPALGRHHRTMTTDTDIPTAPMSFERTTLGKPPGDPITVVLADDHPLYREGLARAIAARLDMTLLGEATDGLDALSLIEELCPDVALLDVKMPTMDGIEACELLAGSGDVPTRIVLLSAFLEPELVARATLAGAAGYLGKDSTRDEICSALARVATGGTAFCEGADRGVTQALERIFGDNASGTKDP